MTVRKILHAADIHLDSPLLRLESYPGAPVDKIRSASRKALTNLIDLAIREQVDLVVIAGDLYDGDWNEFSTGLHFVNEATRLIREQIPLVVIRGNHDAQSVMTQSLPLPRNPDGTAIMLDHDHVDQRVFERIGVVVHGRSFPKKAVTEDLSLGYPAPIRGMFNLGLLHTSLTGADGHDNYSPCKPDQLQDKGYDYWALGHIHDRRECHRAGEAPIVFAGNIQGRNIREVGAKGCLVVSISDDHQPTSVFHPLDVVRWQVFTHDITHDDRRDDLLEAFAQWIPGEVAACEGRPLAVRVNVTGTSPLSHEYLRQAESIAHELRSITNQRGSGAVWFENLKVRTTAPRHRTTASQVEATHEAPLESIQQVIESLREDPEQRDALIQPLKRLWTKLPAELTNHPLEPFRLDDTDLVLGWVEAAEPILLEHFDSSEAAK
ncbi:MAG: metallophosphoesterase family protein [Planctomycetaceae bacterium]